MQKIASEFAERTGSVVVMTGRTDIVTDGQTGWRVENGHPMMRRVTGAGCQLSALTGAFAAANPKKMLQASLAAVCAMGVCGELAADRMGEYTIIVDGNKATASWSKDGAETAGGLKAEAYGPEQLHMLSYDYADTMKELRDLGIMEPSENSTIPKNPRLTGSEIEWTEEDRAEADRALAEDQAQNQKRLAEIAKAETEGTVTVETAMETAKKAIVQEYLLTEEQTKKLNYEPDSTYITYQDGEPLANMLFWLWQKNGDTFTEKDGQYWVTVNLKTGIIDDITYDAGLAGNG